MTFADQLSEVGKNGHMAPSYLKLTFQPVPDGQKPFQSLLTQGKRSTAFSVQSAVVFCRQLSIVMTEVRFLTYPGDSVSVTEKKHVT